ncbi:MULTISPECIES: spore cortex biosynthesis protein YabQ [Lachnospiraceae]|jgi:hypothetical protein|uniref:Spore cortex biosynthesis protein YabQ n=1 Tax=Faecalicatena acetigenes TaxID=2981790 RepID=A0ABT2T999_9FIRM|nr:MULTISPECIES: spore cortex biosynthesis protein YabQ [Lachnospiraceae]MCU6746853.1 spore cortex biosynthesis protein YabQ [Faecalicatena acetigenes]RGT72824.1 hypothetical protein DWX08_08200 [Ruminococcus sp. AF18-22]SCH47572.1 spore cortex biosynthesis protein YabQ [uncultured Clostridium sp.]
MMLGIETEAMIFLFAGLSGITVMLVYDILVLFRKLIRHRYWAVSVEDFLFWFFVSIYLFYQMYRTTYGSIRWFFILGIVSGCLFVYFFRMFLKKIWMKEQKNLEKYKKNR